MKHHGTFVPPWSDEPMPAVELRHAQITLGLNGSKFADAVGLHRTSMSRMQNGRMAIPKRTAVQVRAMVELAILAVEFDRLEAERRREEESGLSPVEELILARTPAAEAERFRALRRAEATDYRLRKELGPPYEAPRLDPYGRGDDRVLMTEADAERIRAERSAAAESKGKTSA